MENYKNVPEFVIERNKKLLGAYSSIIVIITKIQGWLDDERLRTRIESDLQKTPGIKNTMYQCTTPFCVVSLGCDQMGRYNIAYSLDYRIQEMISGPFASTLLRRIYEFTPGELDPFVKIGSLCTDCVQIFNHILEQAKRQPNHEIKTQPKHEVSK